MQKIFLHKCIRTSYLLCNEPACYHSASKTYVRDRVFKMSPIDASVIISLPEFAEFSESYTPFKKNSIISEKKNN